MTTLILTALTSPGAGFAFGGPFGAVAASVASYAVAGYIDSRYIMPKLFPPPSSPTPSVGDLQFQFAEEGSSLPLLLGDEVPSTGGLIWASDIIVREHGSGGGGCGGPAPGGGDVDLFVHCQVAIGEAPTSDGIAEVIEIWKDGGPFWIADPQVSITSTQLTAAVYEEVSTISPVAYATNTTPINVVTPNLSVANGGRVRITGCTGSTAPNGSWTVAHMSSSSTTYDLVGSVGTAGYVNNSGTAGLLETGLLEIQSPSSGPDLTRLRVGVDTMISGWTAPATANNRSSAKCVYVGTTTGGGTVARFDVHGEAVAKAAGDNVTLLQDPPQSSDRDATSVTIHDGSLTDTPDALVEGIEGVGNVPAYRRVPTMVVERLRVTENGGRIGEFKFLTRQQANATRAEMIATVLEYGSLSSSDYDVSEVTGDFRGMAAQGVGSAITRVQPICMAHDILAQQKGELIRFFDHSAAVVVPIRPEDMAAHEEGSSNPEPIEVPDPSDAQLPSEVVVTYIDPRNDWQSGSVRERKRKVVDQDEVVQVNMPIVMTAGEARGLARRMLWLAWGQRLHPRFALPPSYLSLHEGDVATFTVHGEDWRVIIRKLDVGVNWLIQVEGEDDDPQLATILSGPFEDPAGDQPPPVALPGEMAIVMADLPPLVSSRVGHVGFYYGTALQDRNEVFIGASLYASDDVTNYQIIDTIGSEAVIGTVSTILLGVIGGGAPAPTHFFDELNTLTVVLKDGALENKTESLVLAGANRALVGAEVIAFKTATLTAPDTYVLSGLLRGLYDTQDFMARHLINENFMLLNSLAMRYVEIGLSQMGNLRSYKPVVSGGSVTQATGHDFSVDGTCVRHWAPVQAIIRKDSSTDDVAIRWHRRCLAPVQIFGPGYPLSDDSENYEIEVWDAGFTTLKRTLTSTIESVAYTETDQSTDFGTPPATFNLRIFQIHTLTGRSKPLEAAALAPREIF